MALPRVGLKISKVLVQTCPWALLHVDKDESHHANMSIALLHDDRDAADSLSSSFMGQLGALSSEMCTKFGLLLGWALGLRTHRTPSEPALALPSEADGRAPLHGCLGVDVVATADAAGCPAHHPIAQAWSCGAAGWTFCAWCWGTLATESDKCCV
jgi:hypothetical protein